MPEAAEMPRYKSHKQVGALEIAKVDNHMLHFAEKGYAALHAPAEIFSRYTPVAGDFYVQYDDGYKSFSPRKAFLDGYTLVEKRVDPMDVASELTKTMDH